VALFAPSFLLAALSIVRLHKKEKNWVESGRGEKPFGSKSLNNNNVSKSWFLLYFVKNDRCKSRQREINQWVIVCSLIAEEGKGKRWKRREKKWSGKGGSTHGQRFLQNFRKRATGPESDRDRKCGRTGGLTWVNIRCSAEEPASGFCIPPFTER